MYRYRKISNKTFKICFFSPWTDISYVSQTRFTEYETEWLICQAKKVGPVSFILGSHFSNTKCIFMWIQNNIKMLKAL